MCTCVGRHSVAQLLVDPCLMFRCPLSHFPTPVAPSLLPGHLHDGHEECGAVGGVQPSARAGRRTAPRPHVRCRQLAGGQQQGAGGAPQVWKVWGMGCVVGIGGECTSATQVWQCSKALSGIKDGSHACSKCLPTALVSLYLEQHLHIALNPIHTSSSACTQYWSPLYAQQCCSTTSNT